MLGDVALTERQKQVLLEIYESFRRENEGGGEPEPAPTAAVPTGTEEAPRPSRRRPAASAVQSDDTSTRPTTDAG